MRWPLKREKYYWKQVVKTKMSFMLPKKPQSEVTSPPFALHTSSSCPFAIAPLLHPPEEGEGGAGCVEGKCCSAKNCIDTRGGWEGGRGEEGWGGGLCCHNVAHSRCVRERPITKSASQCVQRGVAHACACACVFACCWLHVWGGRNQTTPSENVPMLCPCACVSVDVKVPAFLFLFFSP